jgi:hypothetical protein
MIGDVGTSSSRRSALKLLAGLPLVAIVGSLVPGCQASQPIARASPAAALEQRVWDVDDYDRFIQALPDESIWSLYQSLGLAGPEAPMPTPLDRNATVERINREVVWISSSIFTYPLKDKSRVPYDHLVRWVAREYKVPSAAVEELSTFKVEQAIAVQVFAGIWDSLSEPQRTEVLRKLDPDSTLQDPAGLAAASGTAVAGALAAGALLTGFQFYVTMSAFISSTASLVGLTLPWALYQGASTVVGLLATNPFGWAVLGVGAIASIAWLGGANEKRTAAFICQINALRAASRRAAGSRVP